MPRSRCVRLLSLGLAALVLALPCPTALAAAPDAAREARGRAMLAQLDAPVLFVKRFNQVGIHIYDTFFKWHPGGGIYLIENPTDPPERRRVRPLVGPDAPGTLGEGMYWDPELSWDATRLLFCCKFSPNGSTSIYEIGVDGRNLRRLTDPTPCVGDYKGSIGGVHDVQPAYLPDGRIVFTSTRRHGLVPCANEGVNILHVMNADGSDIRALSVNNVNEFDPCVLPDGRILHGRWEYVDKNALTQQSLWTIFPDGTNETAVYANNMVFPEALIQTRPVPGEPNLLVAALTPHNSPPRGAIAFLDMRRGKNEPDALTNLDNPDNPTHDRGNSCQPWPISRDLVLYSGMLPGHTLNALVLVDRSRHRLLVHADPKIDCHDPMLVKPRPVPPALVSVTKPAERTGRFLVLDIYQGLPNVARGEIKRLRVIEETSRTSATPGGAMNQTFLMSGALAWSAKNYLGVVPVEADGSAYFEAPAGRALYLHALDADGRMVQSMRTFVQAAPGVTRSCIGCHEHKFSTPVSRADLAALRREPSRPQPESWGSGFIDFPSMVQPILDQHCVRCHGGEQGFAGKLDLSGGWTEHFTNSYENLISRRDSQVSATLIAGIDCMNGTALFSVPIRPPRFHGSGAAPLAKELVGRHRETGRIPDLSRTERDLLMAWIDTNGLFHGSWDYSKHGCRIPSWEITQKALLAEMRDAGCVRCHQHFEGDWFNLQRPEFSRILRAPLAKAAQDGYGLALCRDRKVDPREQRVRILLNGAYQHAVQPVEHFAVQKAPPVAGDFPPVVSFASTADPHYQAMLALIRDGRRQALATPRVDMPGAEVIPGSHRQLIPPPLPETLPRLIASADAEGIVRLAWERRADTIGLTAEVHRGPAADFAPAKDTFLATTPLFQHTDAAATPGPAHYALVLLSESARSQPIRASLTVPQPPPPPAPAGLKAMASPGRVELSWQEAGGVLTRYHVYRAAGAQAPERLIPEPTTLLTYADTTGSEKVQYAYTVRAVSRRGVEGAPSAAVTASPLPETKDPVFAAAFAANADAALPGGGTARGTLHAGAKIADGALDLRQGGHATFENRSDFSLSHRLSVECWVRFDAEGQMPVVVSCGLWNQAGWFLQKIGGGWRWHVGGMDCDGGKPVLGQWMHVVCTFDGRTARVYQDGRLAAERVGAASRSPWQGPFFFGQYSGGVAPPYQVTGLLRGLKVYHRVLTAQDAAAAARP